MSQPSNESRISNLEKEAMALGARIEELADDTAEELKAIREEIRDLRIHVDRGFAQAHAYMQEHMATKDDIAELKELIKQLIPYKPNA